MTTENGFILYSLIMKQKFIKKPLYVCFVDFTKAFDYVNRSALIRVLPNRPYNLFILAKADTIICM